MTKWFVCAAVFAVACTPPEAEDTGVELPPEDTYTPTDTGLGSFPVDTSLDTDINLEPLNTLTINQWGTWNLTPFLGPYTTLVGELYVQEYIDDETPDTALDSDDPDQVVLECDLVYSLSGVPAEEDCAGCDGLTFRITYALLSGDPEPCHDPDLPEHGAETTQGFNAGAESVMQDYKDAGLWVPWYSAEKVGDQVSFTWTVTMGVALEEEEDE